jgi:hypothetical protein
MSFRQALTPWLERAIYVSLLSLSRDAAPAVVTARTAAMQVVELLEARDIETLREDQLASTSWRHDTYELRDKTAFIEALGPVVDIEPIEVSELEGRFRVLAERGEWDLDIEITEDGEITRLRVHERAPIVNTPPLSLPVVHGEWRVMWGGEQDALNRRPNERSLRRALELTILDDQGSSHRAEGLDNADYYAHGQPVHAMAAGEVVMVVDGVPDNPPGQAGAFHLGNAVIVRHEDDLHAVYGMLEPGSVTVKPGDVVTIGQRLGACGNSGNARIPRVHVHVQDGPIIGKAWGLQPVFLDVVVEREGQRAPMHEVRLSKRDVVSHPD